MSISDAKQNDNDDPSYIDYEAFLDPNFSSSSFANTLVLATNNPNDSPLDLSTPLSRVLFDIQEIDSHIDQLTTRSAIPLLAHTKEQNEASGRIVGEIDTQIKALNDSYKQLEKEVIQKHAEAEEVRQVATRLWETLSLGRAVGRCLQLGRQLEVQSSECKEDHRALVRCTHTLLSLRELFSSESIPGAEGFGINKVNTVRTLRENIVEPIERTVRETAERIIREFSMGSASSASTFAQAEETRARTVSALTTLYLLSPTNLAKGEKWAPTFMIRALEVYIRSALQSSIAGLSRALSSLPGLEKTLGEVSARCQNLVALEAVLEQTRTPPHPLVPATGAPKATSSTTMLQPLLAYLETGSLASYFWRTMAGSLGSRVQEIAGKGGPSARNLRAGKQRVGELVRECVIRGSQLPSSLGAGAGSGGQRGKTVTKGGKNAEGDGGGKLWDREIAVMVGSVMNNVGN